MLKLDCLLRTDPPALAAARAFGHIVLECSSVVPIMVAQRRGRTIFNAGQTAVAVLVHLKIRHCHRFKMVEDPFIIIDWVNLFSLFDRSGG
jgi:hypothetical protein